MSVLVVARRPRATVNRACAVLIFCFAYWSGCLAVSHYPGVSRETAIRFYCIGSFAWAGFASIAALFIASFVKPALLRSTPFLAALVVPPLVVIHAQWTGKLAADYLPRPWGYSFVWSNSPQVIFFTAYYSLYMIGGIALILWTARRERVLVKRLQARIIGWSALLPLLLGSVTDVVLPRAGIFVVPNAASDLAIVWVLGLAYATVRYQMLDLRPAVAADRVVETMSDALLLANPDGYVVWPNPAAVRLFGRSAEDLRKMTLAQLLPSGGDAVGPPGSQAGRRDVTLRRPDGGELELDCSVSIIRGGLDEVVGWVCVATDVTSRRQVEVALRQARDTLEGRIAERTRELEGLNERLLLEIAQRTRSEEQYRLLIESMQEGVWVLDGGDRTLLVNSRLGQLLGYETQDLLGRPLLDFVDPRSADACAETMRQAHAGVTGLGDWHLVPRSGRALSAIVQISPLPSPIASPLAAGEAGRRECVLTVMDVTERETMQAQLTRAQRLASLGLLAAGVGHEINNPLTYVMLNLAEIERLAKLGDGAPAPEIAELSADALEGARRVQEIVQDLRRFSRGEARPLGLVDVHDALEDAIKLGQNEVRFRATLVRELGAGIPPVTANRASLSQVFLNLIVNAAHAIGEGRQADNEIRIRTSLVEHEVLVEFADTGRGISPEDMERIFDPFFSTRNAGDGLGLGLAICHETIAALGGRIFVGSQPGRGSRFLVALKVAEEQPRQDSEGAAAGIPAPPPALPLAGTPEAPAPVARDPREALATILVIDDELPIRTTLERVLRRHFRVVLADSGEDAKRLITRGGKFDLVLCDLMMPGMTGMDLADWIAEHAPPLVSRLIFMTGGAFTPEAERFLATAANPALPKPFEAADVFRLARRVLDPGGSGPA